VVSADLTVEVPKVDASRVALGFLRAFLAAAGLALASGWAFCISSWFRGLVCFVVFSVYFALPCGWGGRRGLAGHLAAGGFAAAVLLILRFEAPASRVALLAWVLTSEFWVERSLSGKRRRRAGEALVLGAAALAFAGLLTLYARAPGLRLLRRTVPGLGLAGSISLAAVFAYEAAVIAGFAAALTAAGRRAGPSPRAAGALSVLCAVVVLLILLQSRGGGVRCTGRGDCGPPRPISIALYSEGLLDWESPSASVLGLVRSGMFGLFRKSMERYAVSRGGVVVEVDSLTCAVLAAVNLVVFINPTRPPSPVERKRLGAFLAGGGGMLVLGDHTDICGTLAALNGVLEPTSVRFRFDSAISLREGWAGCLEIVPHAVTAGLRDEEDAQVGTGASLEIKRPAFPIVIGRYAFSDRGDYRNGGRGANMGNRGHDAGEALGDLVLVAGEEVGSGRVLVFGDTSPFQNGARFLSQRFIANSVRWLCRDDVVCAGSLLPGMRPFDDAAVIDLGRCPDAARRLFGSRSLGGLANCLCRAGVSPVPGDAVSAAGAGPRAPAFIFMIAPTRRLGEAETSRLIEYMRSGGRLVLAKGYASPEPCAGLLEVLGFGIMPVPLGGGDGSAPLSHGDAWAVTCDGGAGTVVRASAFGFATVVTKAVGHGSFTLIGDGRLLLDADLEGEMDAVPENVEFVTALVSGLRGGLHDIVPPDDILARRHPR